jgi:peroxiredoxin
MTRKVLIVTLAAAVMVLCYASLRAADQSGVKIGGAVPQFTLKDQNGGPVKLSDYKGKIIVLEWTNPDCPFVQRHYEQHTMTNLAREYKDKGVVWLAINSSQGNNVKTNNEWATKNNLSYPILDDSPGEVAGEYRAKTTPDMFIVNKDGTLVYEGGIDNDPDGDNTHRVNYVQKALNEMLAGKSVSTPVTKSYGCGVHYKE